MLDFSRARFKPFRHQEEDAQALVENPYFFISSEMRTGKTKIVIDAAQYLFTTGVINRVLVVTPAPVRDVWYDPEIGELHKHLWEDLPAQIIEYHSRNRSWSSGDITKACLIWAITNYEFIRNHTRLVELLSFVNQDTLLVLDESSFVKTWKAQQTQACMALREKCGRVCLLNGTPISHSPLDLFAQGNILHHSILNCRYITHYKARYAIMGGYTVHGRPTQVMGWTNLEDLQRRFAPYVVRRLQKDCLDLPPKLDPVTLTAELTSATWKHYKEMRDECVTYLEKQPETASIADHAITRVMRLSQITSGFIGGVKSVDFNMDVLGGYDSVCDDSNRIGDVGGISTDSTLSLDVQGSVREIGREKLDILLWFLGQRLEADENLHVVVWCRFRPELHRMLVEVGKKFPQFTIGAIHGGQKKDERLRSMQLLHPDTSPATPVFVGGTFGTGSFGVNFTAANTSINLSFDYSLAKFLQSGDRVYGPGMIGPAAYFDIIATGPKGQKTIDHIIVTARRNRENIANYTTSAWVKALKDE